jgi:hypothetical protein
MELMMRKREYSRRTGYSIRGVCSRYSQTSNTFARFSATGLKIAFYGPIGFDLGAFFGNLLLNWYCQPGHATPDDDRVAHQEWILQQAKIFWETFRTRFLALWSEDAKRDAFPAPRLARPALDDQRAMNRAHINRAAADGRHRATDYASIAIEHLIRAPAHLGGLVHAIGNVARSAGAADRKSLGAVRQHHRSRGHATR